ncbi:hypothetical protein BDZ89DRAFT_1186880 [Hymenopellis radicata]|nr:hypothetical protein BDZ89DRAFT_1186880 [Hymenopellis radicata]
MIGYIQSASHDFSHHFQLHLQLSASFNRLLPRMSARNSTNTSTTQESHPLVLSAEDIRSPVQKSFNVVEKELVHQIGDELDARALSGLHNISSNTSVQSIVLQALSMLPLQSLDTIRARITDLEGVIREFLDSQEYRAEDKRSAYERLYLYRAHVRVWSTADHSDTANELSFRNSLAVGRPDISENSIATLVDRTEPEHAIRFLRQQIVDPTVYYDVFSWAIILQNGLRNGTGWLDVDCKESAVWMTLADWLIKPHACLEDTVCDINNRCIGRASLPIHGYQTDDGFRLIVREHPYYPNSQPATFEWIVKSVLRPSICEYLVRTLYPAMCAHDDYANLSHDILLNLALVQLPSVQSTSGI